LREPNVPLAVIINEYVEITHTFYFDNEAGFVNGVLDAAGKTLRAQ
ncbi:MAG TPA: transcription antitermination factor NusB, partial [Rhodospirillales bacterium]|nr:transcription antitermination factor NusB [Rhodospirillales bacterium]